MEARPQDPFAVVQVPFFTVCTEDGDAVHFEEYFSNLVLVLVRQLAPVEAACVMRTRPEIGKETTQRLLS